MKRGAFLALLVLAGSGCTSDSGGFEAAHVDSRAHDEGFVEVFRVTDVQGLAARTEEIRFVLDGAAIDATWEADPDGQLSVGDRFSFVADAFDRARRLEAFRGEALVWKADYRGGAGDPVTSAAATRTKTDRSSSP